MYRAVIIATVASLLILQAPAFADVVTLTNGKVLEGKVTENGDTVIVELEFGTVRIPRAQVQSIKPKIAPIDEAQSRAGKLEEKLGQPNADPLAVADEWYALAIWARDHSLPEQYHAALDRALQLNPDHAAARAEAGFVQYQGKWMTVAEKNSAMGLVLDHGKWVQPPPPPPPAPPPPSTEDLLRAQNDQLRDATDQLRQQINALQDSTHALLNRPDPPQQIIYAPSDSGDDNSVPPDPTPAPDPALAPPPPAPARANPSPSLPTPPQLAAPKNEPLPTPPALKM